MELENQKNTPTTTYEGALEYKILITCDAPAPLVVNGAAYCGCSLPKDHEEVDHEVTIKWKR